MKLAPPSLGRIVLDMTPLIDIVFQLLIFFVCTLNITQSEGDFEVRLPEQGRAGPAMSSQLPPLKIRLAADRSGNLQSIRLNDQPLADFGDLHRRIGQILGGDQQLAAATEVEINSDFDLAYEHTVAAITAISGDLDERGHVTKWIERIRFATPPTPIPR